MRAVSIKGNSTEQIKTALEQTLADANLPGNHNFKPTLAIVFISIRQDRQAVCEILKKENLDIIGATSSGEFIDGQQSQGEIVMLLLDIKRSDYTILFEDIGDRSMEDATGHLVHDAFQKFEKPAFILLTTLLTSGGRLLDEAKIELYGLAFSGWKPMGVFRTATKSEGNLIFTIDDRPALEMYLHFLGHKVSAADDQIDFFDKIGVHYPFQIERENREPKMCNPIGYNREKQALICESDVPQGSRLRFSTPPDFDIIDTVISKAGTLKNELHAEADALLIFSCAGRLSALGPMAQQENEGLQQVWNAPMAGFYTYGEYGKGLNGKHEFHSTTCSWVTLKEKQ